MTTEKLEERHVATVVLEAERQQILLLRRSDKVNSCQGLWACVSGSLERGENPLQTARRELAEETGLSEPLVTVVRAGRPFRVVLDGTQTKDGLKRALVIHPFLFRLNADGTTISDAVKIDWEHTEAKFTTDVRAELGKLAEEGQTVPRLMETWLRVAMDEESEREINNVLLYNRSDGASAVARLAVQALAACVGRQPDPAPFMSGVEFVRALAYHYVTARPTMQCVKSAVATCVQEATADSSMPWNELVARLQHTAAAVAAHIKEASNTAALRWLKTVPENGVVVTLSSSSTLRECFLSEEAQNKALRLFICESRPGGEGVDLAERLAKHPGNRHDITVIPDSAVLPLMVTMSASGTTCHVVLGADAVYADGSFSNKVGSHMLLLAARECASRTRQDLIRVSIVFDRFKISSASSCLCTPFVTEVVVAQSSSLVGVWNPTFEAVPCSSFPRLEHYTDLPQGENNPTPVSVLARVGGETGSYIENISDISD